MTSKFSLANKGVTNRNVFSTQAGGREMWAGRTNLIHHPPSGGARRTVQTRWRLYSHTKLAKSDGVLCELSTCLSKFRMCRLQDTPKCRALSPCQSTRLVSEDRSRLNLIFWLNRPNKHTAVSMESPCSLYCTRPATCFNSHKASYYNDCPINPLATNDVYINWLVFITEMKSVCCAVRTGSLNKAVCASSLKG